MLPPKSEIASAEGFLPVAPLNAIAIDEAVEPSDETRWRQWRAKGRADDARFRRRMRIVALDAGAIIAIGLAAWFAL